MKRPSGSTRDIREMFQCFKASGLNRTIRDEQGLRFGNGRKAASQIATDYGLICSLWPEAYIIKPTAEGICILNKDNSKTLEPYATLTFCGVDELEQRKQGVQSEGDSMACNAQKPGACLCKLHQLS